MVIRMLAVALLVAGHAVGQDDGLGEEYFPLQVGNTWTYKVSGQDDPFVVKATRREMVGSQTCVRLEGSIKDQVVATEHVAFTKSGLCRFRVDAELVNPPVCILRIPTPKFGRWREQFKIGNRSASASFEIANNEVTVPAGKYEAKSVEVVVFEGGPRVRTTVWYASGVGIVKQTIDEGKRNLVLELEKFTPADND